MGDCNARIGEKQVLPEEVLGKDINCFRKSRDQILNKNGEQFIDLCNDHNLVILNGRITGFSEGHYTFIGGQGCSVIDFCSVSMNVLEYISEFYRKHSLIICRYFCNLSVMQLNGWEEMCCDVVA